MQAHGSDQAQVQVVWAPIEFGAVLAVAAATGNVTMWQQQPAFEHRPSASAQQPQQPVPGSWERRACFSIPGGVRDLGFAPDQNGNHQLAVACQSGLVRLASETCCGQSWHAVVLFAAAASAWSILQKPRLASTLCRLF